MTLRDRVSLAFVIYGLAFGAVLALLVTLAFFELEDRILDAMLTDAARQVEQVAAKGATPTLAGGFTLYTDDVPAELAVYPAGRHEFAQYRHLAVIPGDPVLYLVLDESEAGLDVVLGRMLFLTLLVLLLAVVAGVAIARFVSRKLTLPMQELVQRVDSIDLDKPAIEPLPSDDEIGFLSRRFAAAIDLINAKDRRERDFTRFASHELRSPLTVLRGSAFLLRDETGLGERGKRAVARIERATHRMSRLIDTFLFLGRSEARVRKLPVPAHELLSELRRLAAQAQADGQQLELRVGAVAGDYCSDPALLSIVLENLVGNAARHGDGRLDVELCAPRLLLSNRPAAVADPGHGFGLEICRRIVERLGHELDVTSAEGCYTVTLTLAAPEPAATPEDAAASAQKR